jgi:hypothetical protein
LKRLNALPHPSGMAPIDRKQQAERRFLQLIEDSGLPAPDEVRYRTRSVEFLWLDRKVAVVVDLDDFDEEDADGGYSREGIAA